MTEVCRMMMEEGWKEKLVRLAMEARRMAYAPYSGYCVGAALLTEDGTVYQGGNVENASYGATCCAERTAVYKAVNAGKRKFLAIAIVGGMEGKEPEDEAYPCGICRQVLGEFADGELIVLVAKGEGDYREYTLDELFPHRFGGESIR